MGSGNLRPWVRGATPNISASRSAAPQSVVSGAFRTGGRGIPFEISDPLRFGPSDSMPEKISKLQGQWTRVSTPSRCPRGPIPLGPGLFTKATPFRRGRLFSSRARWANAGVDPRRDSDAEARRARCARAARLVEAEHLFRDAVHHAARSGRLRAPRRSRVESMQCRPVPSQPPALGPALLDSRPTLECADVLLVGRPRARSRSRTTCAHTL